MRNMIVFGVMALSFLLSACGGGVDEGFAGSWRGVATLSSPGIPAQTAEIVITLSVEDGELLVPSCNGPLHVQGDGTHASWAGQAPCPFPIQSCPSGTLTTTEYVADLVGDDRLRTRGVNRFDGCGTSAPVFGSFEGVRQ